MNLIGSSISCGVNQLHSLNSVPENGLKDLGTRMFGPAKNKHAFVIWSDITGNKGEKLYKLIKDKFPKSNVQKTKDVINPNSQNMICLYNWQVPVDDFKAWWDENK